MSPNTNIDISLAVKAFNIGHKVRELRQKNRHTLQDLAVITGLSKPFLSQIENDRVIPPIPTLMKLARGLNVSISYFFVDDMNQHKVSITRKKDRVRIERRPHQEKGEVHYIYVALETKKASRNMHPFLVEFPILDAEEISFTSHEGEEFVYVKEGAIEFRSIDKQEILETGDCIYLESDLSHSFRCVSDKPAKAIVVLWIKPHHL